VEEDDTMMGDEFKFFSPKRRQEITAEFLPTPEIIPAISSSDPSMDQEPFATDDGNDSFAQDDSFGQQDMGEVQGLRKKGRPSLGGRPPKPGQRRPKPDHPRREGSTQRRSNKPRPNDPQDTHYSSE
jgi:hypothetical protein